MDRNLIATLSALSSSLASSSANLDHKFLASQSRSASTHSEPHPSPIELLNRITSLRTLIDELTTEASEVISEREGLTAEVSSLLVDNIDLRGDLERRVGWESRRERNPFGRQSLDEEGEEIERGAEERLRVVAEGGGGGSGMKGLRVDTQAAMSTTTTTATNYRTKTVTPTASLTVTPDDFLTLPSEIKGRARIEDCNNVLGYLVGVFNESSGGGGKENNRNNNNNNNNNAISPSEKSTTSMISVASSLSSKLGATSTVMRMNAAGLKVTGLTGGNVLKSLEVSKRRKREANDERSDEFWKNRDSRYRFAPAVSGRGISVVELTGIQLASLV